MIDTIHGPHSSAIIYSIAETERVNNLKLYDYFMYLFEEIPKHMNEKDCSWIFQSRCPRSPVIRKPIGNYKEYKKSHKCKAGLCPAKRLWAWHSFDSLWVLIKPINGGFRSGIPVSMLPESGFLETRISMFLYRRSVTTVSKLPEEIRNQQ